MAYGRQVKRRRGTQAENDAFTGAEGEIVCDMTNKRLRLHDGAQAGGFAMPNMTDFESFKSYMQTLFSQLQTWVQQQIANIEAVPTGAILSWSSRTLPAGRWLWCNGAWLLKTDYPDLNAKIGNVYGGDETHLALPHGDGYTMFALDPTSNLVGTLTNGSMPYIWGQFDLLCEGNYKSAVQNTGGALAPRGRESNICRPSSSGRATWDFGIDFNAARSSSIFTASMFAGERAVPASCIIPGFIIKY